MNIYDFSTSDKLYVIGLFDNNFDWLFHAILPKNKRLRSSSIYFNSVIILSGGNNITHHNLHTLKKYLNSFNDKLQKFNINIVIIRGNNDEASVFEETAINLSNIKTIPDYSILKMNDKNVLCVGGNISLNRTWKQKYEAIISKFKDNETKIYWDDESFNFDDERINEIIKSDIKIDGVITNISPLFAFPPTKMINSVWLKNDKGLYNDIQNERLNLDKLFQILSAKNKLLFWVYNGYDMRQQEQRKDTYFFSIYHHEIFDPLSTINELEENNKNKNEKIDSFDFNKILFETFSA